ncbi:hypothetical protein D3C85_1812560 [compost metagenome]
MRHRLIAPQPHDARTLEAVVGRCQFCWLGVIFSNEIQQLIQPFKVIYVLGRLQLSPAKYRKRYDINARLLK